jgi:hypothetical protein
VSSWAMAVVTSRNALMTVKRRMGGRMGLDLRGSCVCACRQRQVRRRIGNRGRVERRWGRGNLVVRGLYLSEPDVQNVFAGRCDRFLEHPRLEARLRQKLSVIEAWSAPSAMLRTKNMDAGVAVSLFGLIPSATPRASNPR